MIYDHVCIQRLTLNLFINLREEELWEFYFLSSKIRQDKTISFVFIYSSSLPFRLSSALPVRLLLPELKMQVKKVLMNCFWSQKEFRAKTRGYGV